MFFLNKAVIKFMKLSNITENMYIIVTGVMNMACK